MGGLTVFSGPERRRRWSDEGRGRILAEAFAPGACAAEVARRHDVSTGLLYTWRKKFRGDLAGPGFAEALVSAVPDLPATSGAAVVIEMSGGGRVHISASTPPALVAAVLKALR
ncbi:MAG: IS66-like element accessory protein TnpA [Janthinobacterium lividum]